MEFGKQLRLLRKEKNLTLRELEEQTGITYSALGKYERDERQPDFDTLEKLANYFDVSIDWLLGRTTGARSIYNNYVKPVFKVIKILEAKNESDQLTLEETELFRTLKDYIDEDDGIYPEIADLAKEYLNQNSNDIAKRLEAFKEDLENSNGLSFDGEPMTDTAKESLLESMELLLKQTQRINKLQQSKDDN